MSRHDRVLQRREASTQFGFSIFESAPRQAPYGGKGAIEVDDLGTVRDRIVGVEHHRLDVAAQEEHVARPDRGDADLIARTRPDGRSSLLDRVGQNRDGGGNSAGSNVGRPNIEFMMKRLSPRGGRRRILRGGRGERRGHVEHPFQDRSDAEMVDVADRVARPADRLVGGRRIGGVNTGGRSGSLARGVQELRL